MASYGSLTLPFCNCLHQSDDIQNDPSPHIHTLTQTCHSRGMQGMHTPPREWSPSIQWAELPTVEYTLRGSKSETPHPFKLTTTNPYIPPNWVKRESNPFQRAFFFLNPPSQHCCPCIAQSWIWNSSLLSDVGHHDEVYTITLSHFKGVVLVQSAQERGGFTAGDKSLCKDFGPG